MNLENLLETKHSLGCSRFTKYGTPREAATVDLDGDDIMIPRSTLQWYTIEETHILHLAEYVVQITEVFG